MSTQLTPKLQPSSKRQLLIYAQIEIQRSLVYPHQVIYYLLLIIPYIQILKYPFDPYIGLWTNQSNLEEVFWTEKMPTIFSYLSSELIIDLPEIIGITISLVYSIVYLLLIIFPCLRKRKAFLSGYKALSDLLASFLYMILTNLLCKSLRKIPLENAVIGAIQILSFISLLVCTSVLMLQNYLNFDMLSKKESRMIHRSSNWSMPFLLFYILVNQITLALCCDFNSEVTLSNLLPHLCVMNIFFLLFSLIAIFKKEIHGQAIRKMQQILTFVNLVAIIMVDAMILLSFWLDITFWILLCILGGFTIWWHQGYTLQYELQNINKWNNSEMMIKYTKGLFEMVQNRDQYLFQTRIFGYIQVHNQKCDNQVCPLKFFAHFPPSGCLQILIKTIYRDGSKLNPVSQNLLLDFATFLYNSKNKEKSLEVILSMQKNELSLQRLYYYCKLKSKVYAQIEEEPNQHFLNIFLEMKVKDYENQIIKKFQESALLNLEFWSVLNEQHPDFIKLYQLGLKRVQISQQVSNLYTMICSIAHSQKITYLYIHYLKDIENNESLYSKIFSQLDEKIGLQNKVMIEDWGNTSNLILIVSTEEGSEGKIISLNTACATLFGYEKHELTSRNINYLFPEYLSCQIERFLKIDKTNDAQEYLNPHERDRTFFPCCSSGYCIKIIRKTHYFNSLGTGPSAMIKIEYQFIRNTCFMLFSCVEQKEIKTLDNMLKKLKQEGTQDHGEQSNERNQLLGISSSCIQYLGVDSRLVEAKRSFPQICRLNCEDIQTNYIYCCLEKALEFSNIEKLLDKRIPIHLKSQTFFIRKFVIQQFYALIFSLDVQDDEMGFSQFEKPVNNHFAYTFKITNCFDNFTYQGAIGHQKQQIPLEKIFCASLPDQNYLDRKTLKNFSENITTLRLHQNYISIIEDVFGDTQRDINERASETSSTKQLFKDRTEDAELLKKDEETILSSHKAYCQFIDRKKPHSKVLLWSLIFSLASILTYFGSYLTFREHFSSALTNYDKILNKNAIIAQIAIAKFLLLQIKMSLLTNKHFLEAHILKTMGQFIEQMQILIPQHTEQFLISVAIAQDPLTLNDYLTSQFFLSYASYFEEIYNTIQTPDLFFFNPTISTLDEYSSWYIEYNGGQTKDTIFQNMLDFVDHLNKLTENMAIKNLGILIGGIIVQIAFLIILFSFIRKVNESKIQILSIFLESNEKIIQSFSSKTEKFLMTLHAEDSNDDVEPVLPDAKKGNPSSNNFVKKKIFKEIRISKTPLLFLVYLGVISSGYYLHSFLVNQSNLEFVKNAYFYGSKVSQIQNILFTGVSNVKTQILKKYEQSDFYRQQHVHEAIEVFKREFIVFEKEFLEIHFKTFGAFQQFHDYFVKIYLEDICEGEIKIEEACQNPLSRDGVSIVITQLTTDNAMFWDKILKGNNNQTAEIEILYYKNLEIIKHSHEAFREKSIQFWKNLSVSLVNQSFSNLIIWTSFIILTLTLLQVYLRRSLMMDFHRTQSMLKLLPISFVYLSPRLRIFINKLLQRS